MTGHGWVLSHGHAHANGSSYQAQNSSGAPNPPASQLRPGDELYVTYDPQKPQVSCACDPKPIMSGARYAWIPVVTMAGTAFVLTLVLGLGLTYAQTRRGITN